MASPRRPDAGGPRSYPPRPAHRSRSLFSDVGRLARSTGALMRDHLLLAQAEMKQEGKRAALNVGVGLVALPFALTALIMLSVALAIGLSRWLGAGWAFLIVGVLDLLIAGGLGLYAAMKLKEEKNRAFSQTKEELQRDRRVAREVVEKVRTPEAPPVRSTQAPDTYHSPRYARRLNGDGGGVHESDRV